MSEFVEVTDKQDAVIIPLMQSCLILTDYTPRPSLKATAYRFSLSTQALAPNETVFRNGMLNLVFLANPEDDDVLMPIETVMGIFLDEYPLFAVTLSKQHEWELQPITRSTFSPFTTRQGLLHEVHDESGQPLFKVISREPDPLLMFILGNPVLDKYYPARSSFLATHHLAFNAGDPPMLESKPVEANPFTVRTLKRTQGVEYDVRADHQLYTLFIPDNGEWILGTGRWANDYEAYAYLPIVLQMYRITSVASFVPFLIAGEDWLKQVCKQDEYQKRIQDYITQMEDQSDSV